MCEKFFQGYHHKKDDNSHKDDNSYTIPEKIHGCCIFSEPAIEKWKNKQDGFDKKNPPENTCSKDFPDTFVFIIVTHLDQHNPLLAVLIDMACLSCVSKKPYK